MIAQKCQGKYVKATTGKNYKQLHISNVSLFGNIQINTHISFKSQEEAVIVVFPLFVTEYACEYSQDVLCKQTTTVERDVPVQERG